MVNLGFIVEGYTEKMIVRSERFLSLLHQLQLNFVGVIDIEGGGNLLPENLTDNLTILTRQGATQILIVTDLENSPCITAVKARINIGREYIIVVAVRAIEAWFLADTTAISIFMGRKFECQQPEIIDNPFFFVKTEKLRLVGRGVNSKRLLCSRMLQSGFSIEAAAAHPNCPSAKYFIQKLKSLAAAE